MHNIKIQVAALPLALLVALVGCGGSSGGGDGAGGAEPLGLVTEDNATAIATAAFRNIMVVPLLPLQYDQLAELVVLDVTGDDTGTFDCDTSGQVTRTVLETERFDERLTADACRFEDGDFDIIASFMLERGADRDWPEFTVAFPAAPGLQSDSVQDYFTMRSGDFDQTRISTGDEDRFTISGSVTRRVGVISPDTYPAEGDDYHVRWEYDASDVRLDFESEDVEIDLGRQTRMAADWFFDIESNGSTTLVTREASLEIDGRVRVDNELFDVNARSLQYNVGTQPPPAAEQLRNQPTFLGLNNLFGLPCPALGVIDVDGADNTGLRVVFTQGAANAVFVQAFTAEGTHTLQYEFCSDFLAMNPVD